MMDYKKLGEEALREAACLGDLESLEYLISVGVNVNSRNDMNGWTALHWAACRGNAAAVTILLRNGANKLSLNNKCQTPSCLASTKEVCSLLGAYCKQELQLPITPNYLKNPPLSSAGIHYCRTIPTKDLATECKKGLVLRLRIKEEPCEFVEVEIPGSELTFEGLKTICANELNKYPEDINKIMKLPNTIIRNDRDVLRLNDFQEIACFFDLFMKYS